MEKLIWNRRWLLLLAIFLLSSILITGISMVMSYRKSLSVVESNLREVVERQATLIKTLNEQGNSQQQIIDFFKLLHFRYYDIGEGGKFAIARREGDSVLYLFSGSGYPFYKTLRPGMPGAPMYLALSRKSGFIKAKDYEGIPVYAAYTYIPSVNLGLVAKVPVAEIERPYIETFIKVAIIFFILITVSLWLFIRISTPVFRGIIESERKFRLAVQSSSVPIMIHAEDGEVLNISKGWTEITGYRLADIPTIDDWAGKAYCERKAEVIEIIRTLYDLNGSSKNGEYCINCLDGSKRIWDFSSTSIGKLSDGRKAVISIASDVTERKEEEERVRQSEERFFHFFNEMGSGCSIQEMVYDDDGTPVDYITVDCNKAFEKLLGVRKEDVTGKPASLFMSPDELKEWLDIFSEVAASGFSKPYEQFSSGNNKYFRGVVFNTHKGGFAVTFDDITQQKQAENLLKESEQRFRSIIENTKAGYFFLDNEGIIRQVNKAWLDLYKYSDFSEVIGKHFVEVQQIDDVETAKALVSEIRNGNPAFMTGDFSRKCKDGSTGYHSFSSRPVFEGGVCTGIEGFILDITHQKEAELELLKAKTDIERNKLKFESMLNAMQEGVYLHDMVYDSDGKAVNYRIVEANPISEKYLNIKREDAIGKLATELYGTTEAPYLDVYAGVAETGEPFSFEQHFAPMDKHFLISVFSPKKGQFATAFLDITSNKKFEQELIRAKEQAEESDRLKTAFLQNVSHEIRTPMNAIMGFAELLPQSFDDPEKLSMFSGIINRRCNDLLDIINDILDISRIESGHVPVNIEHCDLPELFAELEAYFRKQQVQMKKEHIALALDAGNNARGLTIATDPVKLRQILINLINNALKFTEQGVITGGFRLDDQGLPVFFVSDTGIGIPADKHEFIFGRFAQLNHATVQNLGGTGLGLSIVKGLVELLGGKIWVESEPGKGSTFFFTLDAANHVVITPEADSVTIEADKDRIAGKKVLIVEDDQFNMELIREILSPLGLDLHMAATGGAALEIYDSHHFDLVLMDIGLPDMDGYTVIRQILSKDPAAKIISQTAYAMTIDKKKAFETGCIGYISKPIVADKLRSLIFRHLA